MNRRKYITMLVTYTIFNIGALVLFNYYRDEDERVYVEDKNSYVEMTKVVEENQQLVNADHPKNKDKMSVESPNYAEESQKSSNNVEDKFNTMYESDKNIYNNSSYDYKKGSSSGKNKNVLNESIKVFKLTAEEIISDLTPIEKAKILWVCRKLTKEEYYEIEEYLSYRNEKIGVIKVYNVLESKLDEESLEDVKEIFSKYMDLEKVEEIN